MDQQKIIQELKQALQYKNRSKDILDTIAKGVQDLKFFKEKQAIFDPTLYFSMLRKLQLKDCKKGEVLFHFGSNNVDQFYVILLGQVAILCPNEKGITHQQVLEEYKKGIDQNPHQLRRQSAMIQPRLSLFNNRALKDIIMAQAYGSFLGINLQKIDQESLLEEYNNNPNKIQIDKWLENYVKRLFPSLHIVNMCNQGEQFGEIAIIGNVTRTATVLCTQDTSFITLSNPDFQLILQQYHEQVKNEKIALLRNFELFNKLSDKKLRNMLENIIVQKPTMFTVIYQENSQPEFIYFVKQGEIELLKILPKNQLISIALLQIGCVFGYEEVQNQTTREYRAISKSSQCELYLLPIDIIQQFEKKGNSSVEKRFHHTRLDQLLNDKIQKTTTQKKMKISQDQYKEEFEKEYSTLFTHSYLSRKAVPKKHKKILSEPFIPFFDIETVKTLSQKNLTERRYTQSQSKINKDKSLKLHTQTSINIHRHLFSPKITKRQLDIIMPFKRKII